MIFKDYNFYLMKHKCLNKTYKIIVLIVLPAFALVTTASAQNVYQPYSFDFYQKLSSDLYSTKSNEHTAIKPFAIDSALRGHYDSLMNYGSDHKQHSLLYNKLFNEHLIDYKGSGSTFYADLLPDFDIGRDFSGKLTTSATSLGLQLGGTIGNKFYYNVTGYESSAVVPNYIS